MDIYRKYKSTEIIKRINNGDVFIYPTDTIYGIGCDATNKKAVAKLRKIKNRSNKPFSVWVPSFKWIEENCDINLNEIKHLFKNKVTLIVKLKKHMKHLSSSKRIGIRMPNHSFGKIVKKLNKPIVSTSVNLSGEKPMTSLRSMNKGIKVDFIVYEGAKNKKASKIIDIVEGKVIR